MTPFLKSLFVILANVALGALLVFGWLFVA
jgi:hypothetical protein